MRVSVFSAWSSVK